MPGSVPVLFSSGAGASHSFGYVQVTEWGVGAWSERRPLLDRFLPHFMLANGTECMIMNLHFKNNFK